MSLIGPSVGLRPPDENGQDNELVRAHRKALVEIQSQLFDKAATYSNLIMVGGYAGAFTIWGSLRTQLSVKANVAIALLLGFSLLVFIFYQALKMATHILHFRSVRALLNERLTTAEFLEKFNALDQEARRFTLRTEVAAWSVVFVLCILPAFFGLVLLFGNFALLMFGWSSWPADIHSVSTMGGPG